MKLIVNSRVALAGFFFSCSALAQQDADLDALKLADQMTIPSESPSNWRIFTEGALGEAQQRASGSFQPDQRLSFDVQYDNSLTRDWRFVFADRLDVDNPAGPPYNHTINTIKESYFSWQAESDLLFDFGRINDRHGVAIGYNPTDYLKTGAVRSEVSVDPASLKENRQGSVMLHMQSLSETSSTTLLYSPKIEAESNGSGANFSSFSPDFAATNNQNRWILTYSNKITNEFNPQVLVYQSDQLPVQLGLNMTSLLGDSTVIYGEWSGGHSPSLLVQAQQQLELPHVDDSTFHQRLASGLTYTTTNKIALTAEFDYNGNGLTEVQSQAQAVALERHSQTFAEIYGLYSAWLLGAQEPINKDSAFFYLSWQDAFINHLDLSAMERWNMNDGSRLSWTEARYHLTHSEFALQWQRYSGSEFSEYGATSQTQSWMLLGRFYF